MWEEKDLLRIKTKVRVFNGYRKIQRYIEKRGVTFYVIKFFFFLIAQVLCDKSVTACPCLNIWISETAGHEPDRTLRIRHGLTAGPSGLWSSNAHSLRFKCRFSLTDITVFVGGTWTSGTDKAMVERRQLWSAFSELPWAAKMLLDWDSPLVELPAAARWPCILLLAPSYWVIQILNCLIWKSYCSEFIDARYSLATFFWTSIPIIQCLRCFAQISVLGTKLNYNESWYLIKDLVTYPNQLDYLGILE